MNESTKSTWIRAMSAFETLWEIMPEKLPPHLRGIVGEVMVWLKLEENCIDFTPKGGQFAYDIEIANGKRVEVRTSMSIDHKPTKTKVWGWQLQKRNKKEKDGVNYDYLICVGLGGNFNLKDAFFLVIPRAEAMQARDIDMTRFKGVKKKLWFYESLAALDIETEKNRKTNPTYVCDWEIKVNRNKDDFQKWSILK